MPAPKCGGTPALQAFTRPAGNRPSARDVFHQGSPSQPFYVPSSSSAYRILDSERNNVWEVGSSLRDSGSSVGAGAATCRLECKRSVAGHKPTASDHQTRDMLCVILEQRFVSTQIRQFLNGF
uniref:Uncharacterized protein n=1 Tax=Anopheles atroparvus TaxID=41427 RepID=A0AAG5D604_ANOAO